MAIEKKSTDFPIEVSAAMTKAQMMGIVERAAAATDLYISHIGGYSRVKYPDSVH